MTPETFAVRLLTRDGTPVGIGTLVSGRHILTCAHVVNTALARAVLDQDQPSEPVRVDFPFAKAAGPWRARVIHWVPPPTADRAGDDIAGLELTEGNLPADAVPARLAIEQARTGGLVRVYGCPAGRPDGEWVDATIRERVASGRFQLDCGAGHQIRQGFSGSPVFDTETGLVVGIVAMASLRSQDPDSYAISAQQLRVTWPAVLDKHRRSAISRRGVGILHVSGIRCGAEPDLAEPLARLPDDVAWLAESDLPPPDLLVVTGDLTEHGRPAEFQRAFGLVGALAEGAGIPRRHVAVVPGSRDVNHSACRNYFADQEEEGAAPVLPYFPKWKYFAKAVTDFYDDADVFTPDEPWTLFEMPDLQLVVAGMNSTYAESHLNHSGLLGNDQLNWFARRLRVVSERGWLRIGAIHDVLALDLASTGGSMPMNVLFHGGGDEPNRLRDLLPLCAGATGSGEETADYQLIVLRRDGYTRHRREFARGRHRWSLPGSGGSYRLAGADSTLPEIGSIRRFPQSDYQQRSTPATFFDLVLEAARARLPGPVITPRADEGYFRVARWLPGGGTAPYPVGVVQTPTGEAVDAFIDGVHAFFKAADPQVPSELVYGGPPAPPQLIAHARKHGVTLRSFTEYQGLLDLRPLVARQGERLAADRQYPADLYIQQRYRVADRASRDDEVRTGLLGQALEWLATSGPRLVMVLGDFGRGKTALLKQLTRIMPAELPNVLPILVEMRGLEKAPTLDQLLVRHLADHVAEISLAKLDYMIRSGRIALLFDGFDELELRVGYDSATDYLRTMLDSVTDRAKVVITSRTQHFMSTEQVRTALGERVEALATSRIAVLEDFTEDQITQFLAGRYGGDMRRAQARLELLKSTGSLLGLARNPRMLTFVAALDEDRLRTVSNGADLYREIIEFWLGEETKRQAHPRGLRSLRTEERFTACIKLALRMWTSGEPTIGLSDLSAEVNATLTELTERGYTEAYAAHAIGSGSLLVRGEDGTFRFIHQSIMEWLVAEAAAIELTLTGTAEVLLARQVSRLMAGFFAELAGADQARDWAITVAADANATAPARQNAAMVTGLLGRGANPLNLASTDLRTQDLTALDLRGANLRGANLRGMQLRDIDLTGADLTAADLTGARLTGGSLRDTTLTGSVWHRAAILGTALPDAPAPELAAAAIPGRDPAEVMMRSPADLHTVAYSPDGALLAIGSGSVIEIADASDGTILRILRDHHGKVRDVTFSPDGTRLATASDDQTARIWDTTTAETITTLTGHDSTVNNVAYSPDGTRIATASADGTARIWDATTGDLLSTLTGHDSIVNNVAYSPDGTRIATSSDDQTVRIWDTSTGDNVTTLTGHDSPVWSVAYSPDGTLIATASDDGTARIWDTSTGDNVTTLTGHDGPVWSLAYSPDGTRIATASDDRTARIWDTSTGETITTLTSRDSTVSNVAYSPDGTRIATASDDRTARIWDTSTGYNITTLTSREGDVNSVAYSPDGTRIATTSDDGTVRIWDTTTGDRVTILTGHDSTVSNLAYSPDGTRIATGSDDGTARIWDTATGDRVTILTGHDRDVNGVAYSPDGTQIATASDDQTARIWDTTTDDLLTTLTGHDSIVWDVAFSPDGTRAATASSDNTARIWDTTTGDLLTTLTGHDGAVNSVAYSPDGTQIATASDDQTARIWDTSTGDNVTTLTGHGGWVWSVVYSPDGTQIATAASDRTVHIWDTTGGTTLTGHGGTVYSVAYSPDGIRIATASADGTARIWDAATGDVLTTLIPLEGNGYAALFPDGSYTLDGDPGDRLWWSIKLCRFAPGELDPYVPDIRRR